MKTNVVKSVNVETNLEKISLDYFDDKLEDIFTIGSGDEEKYAELFKCSPKLVETLLILVEEIKDKLGADLRDIWDRLDRIEKVER